MNLTGRNHSLGLTTISSEPSSRSTIRNRCSSFMKVSAQTSGTQTSSAESEAASSCRTHWGCLGGRAGGQDAVPLASPFAIHVSCQDIRCTNLTLLFVSTRLVCQAQPEQSDGTRSWQREWSRIRYTATSMIGVGGSVF